MIILAFFIFLYLSLPFVENKDVCSKYKGAYMGKPEMNKARAEYVSTNISLRDLSKKYKIPESTLYKRSASENWTEKREKHGRKMEERLEQSSIDSLTKYYSAVERLISKVDSLIESCEKPADIKALSGVLKDIKDIKGLKSDLDIEEQKAKIESLRRGMAEDTAREITVSFGGEAKKYLN